jgi:PAS domain S-box-containing protein
MAPSEELLRILLESAKDYAIFTIDPNGLTTSWSAGAQRLLGYPEDEIFGRSADVIFTPEDRASGAAEQERRDAVSHGRAEDDRWHVRRDGSRFWASGILTPLTDPALGFVKILRDRTEQFQANEQLRESEDRFRLLATSIPQLVFRCRATGERTWPSPQWCTFTGQTFKDSLGFGWLDSVHPEDREATLQGWRDAQRSGEYYVEHRVVKGSDGEYRWHQTRAKPLDGGSDTAEWVGTMTDIHDLRELHDRQTILLEELQHRTRNLLAVVQSIARETLRSSTSLDVFGPEFEDRLRALGRVQGLLARSQDDSVELAALVAAELSAYKRAKAEGDIRIEGPNVLLPGASAQTIALAIHELATNAVKHGALKQSSGKLAVTWQVAGAPDARRLDLEWREAGVQLHTQVPEREGYGSVLIKRALPYQLKAKTNFEFAEDGVRCQISIPLPDTDKP